MPDPSLTIVDTDVFSYLLRADTRGDSYKPHLQGVIPALTFVTVAELYKGAFKDNWSEDKVQRLDSRIRQYFLIPLDEAVAIMWARIQTSTPARTFPVNDAWIAACALTYGCPVVSHNYRDFHDIPGIHLISYGGPPAH